MNNMTINTQINKDVELLAPAGDYESAIGAINAGADAVYLGAPNFSARAYAKNLTSEEIINILHYAHLHNRKIYLALNTLIKNTELSSAIETVAPLYEEGLDGIIVQDIGLLVLLRKAFPKLELHASTQMAILSSEGINWLKQLGVTRVVPGRELSIKEIESLKKAGLEIECFVHGAMCYSYSGRCLMSSLAGGRSGNRGRCAGPCRKNYDCSINDKKYQGYMISMKDMCALSTIEDLIASGIDSFKIEGRMKDPAYTAGVTSVYRKYIDLVKNGNSNIKIAHNDLKLLEELYIRSEIQEGYYHKHNGQDMITMSSPAYNGINECRKDEIYEKYINSYKKQKISMILTAFVDNPICLTINMVNKNVNTSVTVTGDILQKAEKRATVEADIKKQILKLGNSFYECDDLEIYTDESCFIPVAVLNQLRRTAIERLENEIFIKRKDSNLEKVLYEIKYEITNQDKKVLFQSNKIGNDQDNLYDNVDIRYQVETKEQLMALLSIGCKDIIIPMASNDFNLKSSDLENSILSLCKDIEADINKLNSSKNLNYAVNLYLKLPDIVREKDLGRIKRQLELISRNNWKAFKYVGITGVYCSSVDAIAIAQLLFDNAQIVVDNGIQVFNVFTEKFLLEHCAIYSASYELNAKELNYFNSKSKRELIIYGKQEMMQSANCIINTLNHCDKNANNIYISDEGNRKFLVLPRHSYCYSTTYNYLPLSLHNYLYDNLMSKANLHNCRVIFTDESATEVSYIVGFYEKIIRNKEQFAPNFEYTTGHIKRGVE